MCFSSTRSASLFRSLASCAIFTIDKSLRKCHLLKPEASGLVCVFFSLRSAASCRDCRECETGDGQLIDTDQRKSGWTLREEQCRLKGIFCVALQTFSSFLCLVFSPLFVFFLSDASREQTAVRLSVPVSSVLSSRWALCCSHVHRIPHITVLSQCTTVTTFLPWKTRGVVFFLFRIPDMQTTAAYLIIGTAFTWTSVSCSDTWLLGQCRGVYGEINAPKHMNIATQETPMHFICANTSLLWFSFYS